MSSSKDPSNFSFDDKNKADGQAKVVIKGSTRFVTPCSIFPTEIKALSTWNMIQNIAYSSSFSLFFFGIGIIVQAIFVGFNNLNPASKAITSVVAPIIMILGIVCFILGKYLSKSIPDLTKMIQRETQLDDT